MTAEAIEQHERHELAAMDALDLLLLLFLLPLHWVCFFLVVGQWFVRRNPALLAGILRYVDAEALRASPTAHEMLPGLKHTLPPPSEAPDRPRTPARAQPPVVQLADISRADNILIVGGKGSGKTTLLSNLLAARTKSTHYVLDPHAYPNKWRGHRVIGGGGGWQDIAQAITFTSVQLQRRSEQLARGEIAEGAFPHKTLVADEWRAIVHMVGGTIGQQMSQVLTQGRKFNLAFLAAAHNDTAAALGVQGDKEATMSSFDWLIYMGGFASPRLERLGVAHIPTFISRDGTESPLLAVAHHVGARRDYLLDLRTLAWHLPPSQVQPRSDDPLLCRLLQSQGADQQPATRDQSGAPPPQTAQPAHQSHTPDQAAPAATTPTNAEDQSGSQSVQSGAARSARLVSDAEILQRLHRGDSKNAIARWIGGGKARAYERIEQAIQRQRGEGDEPPPAFRFLDR